MRKKKDFFRDREDYFSKRIDKLKSKYKAISFYRILVFLVFLIVGIWMLKVEFLGGLVISIMSFLLIYILLIRWHNRINRQMILDQKLMAFNQEEVKRIEFDFDGIFDGEEFINESHPYTSDLDIFGRNSIFQLVNRAGTFHGIELVKSWLEKRTDEQNILTRQQAVRELIPLVDWRQQIQAHGRLKTGKRETEAVFNHWLKGEDFICNNNFYRWAPYIISVLSLGIIIGSLFELVSFYFLLLPVILTSFFILKILDYSRGTYQLTLSGVEILESIRNMVVLIENQRFNHTYLKGLNLNYHSRNLQASNKINNLKHIFEWLSLRGNQIYHLLNSFFLLDYFIIEKAEKWRAKYKEEVSNWIHTIAEFEALNSLAAFAFANENYAFPQIVKDPYTIRCTDLGHPLIPDASRVSNDFHLHGKGNTCIITGSNMAGKSTFLRTIGVNAVLAYAGAPVCAGSFQVSGFQIFTSMRTKDNLEENISSFYAELIRLKMLLDQIREYRPILYLLDEILKGTNTVDRHIGAESLILQLNETNCFGLVSTHDLKLGELQKTNNKILNYNFSSSIIGDDIVFDYKLREGICESTNASQLMAKIGIQIKS